MIAFQRSIFITCLLAVQVLAFTNGTLVPAYLCNAAADGLPKTFGQVLALTREQTPAIGFNGNKAQNAIAPVYSQQKSTLTGNAAYVLASLHDSPNSIKTQQNTLMLTPVKGNVIVAGQANAITLSTRDASQLKGAVIVGQDGTGQRQGRFTDVAGGPFVPFGGCGVSPNAQGETSGMIQQRGITAQSSYEKLVFNAPDCIPGSNITFAGLSVTGTGFGQWLQTFEVIGSLCAPASGLEPAAGVPVQSAPSSQLTPPKQPVGPQSRGPQASGLPQLNTDADASTRAITGSLKISSVSPKLQVIVTATVTKVTETFTTVFVKA